MCPIDPHDPALEQWLCGEECCLQTAAFEVYNTRGSWRVCATHLAPLLHEELETHPRSPWTFVTDPNGERHGRDHITMGTALAAAMQAARRPHRALPERVRGELDHRSGVSVLALAA